MEMYVDMGAHTHTLPEGSSVVRSAGTALLLSPLLTTQAAVKQRRERASSLCHSPAAPVLWCLSGLVDSREDFS